MACNRTNETTQSPPRLFRRFRFSLRALFVAVTVACAWLGYHGKWVRERHQCIEAWNPGGWGTVTVESCYLFDPVWCDPPPSGLPFGLRLFGELPLTVLPATDGDPAETDRLRRLFPETGVPSDMLYPLHAAVIPLDRSPGSLVLGRFRGKLGRHQ